MTITKRNHATDIKNLEKEMEDIEREGITLKKTARKIIDNKKVQSILKKISKS